MALASNSLNDYLGLTYLQQYFTYTYCLGGVSKNSIAYLPPSEDPASVNHASLPSFVTKSFDDSQVSPPTIGVPRPHDFSNFPEYFVQRGMIFLDIDI